MQTAPDQDLPPDAGAPPPDAGAAPPAAAAAPPDAGAPAADPNSLTGGEQFIPSGAQTAGPAGDHPISEQPEAADDTQVTPEEQKQYDDFVTRAKLFIHDARVPKAKNGSTRPNAKAPRDVIIDHLNIKGMPAADAVGRTTAQVCWILYMNAKRQGYPYSPDVLYHGADEIMSDIYRVGVSAGVIKNPPPDGSVEEQHLLGMAKLTACRFFGQNLIDTGQANQQEAQQYYLAQIQREGESGELDHWDPSKQFTPAQLSQFLAKASKGDAQIKGRPMPNSIADFAAAGRPQLVPTDGSDQGAPPPDQGAPPPDQGAAPPPDQGAPPPDQAAAAAGGQ